MANNVNTKDGFLQEGLFYSRKSPLWAVIDAPGAEAANVINIAFTLYDSEGNGRQSLANNAVVEAYLSDNADGTGITATAPSVGVSIGTNGFVLGEVVAGKYFKLQCNASGQIDLDINDVAVGTRYLVVVTSLGQTIVSDAITFA